MKKFLSINLLFCLILMNTEAQTVLSCGVSVDSTKSKAFIQSVHQFITQHPKPNREAFTVPVVFHVFKNASQPMEYEDFLQHVNIESISQKLIQQVNDDLNGLSPYLLFTPEPFLKESGSTGIRLCLAKQTPEGKATSGIIYHEEVYTTEMPGKDFARNMSQPLDPFTWDPERYINIFFIPYPQNSNVVGETVYSAAHAPSWSEETYVGCKTKIMVNASNIFLDPDHYKNETEFSKQVIDQFKEKKHVGLRFLSTTAITHELCHIFGLPHLEGPTGCDEDDGFTDTPPQQDNNFPGLYVNQILPFPLQDPCNQETNGVMYHNFMSNYALASMLTNQQCAFVQNFVSTKYPKLIKDNPGCTLGECIGDNFEPNESFDAAADIVMDINTKASFLARLCKDDKDFYKVNLLTPQTHNFKVTLSNAPGDYAIEVSYEKEGEVGSIFDESDKVGVGVKEEVIVNNVAPTTLFIEVFSKKGDSHPFIPYLLSIEASSEAFNIQKEGGIITNNATSQNSKSILSPNPATDKVTIINDNFKTQDKIKVTISDMYGNKKFESDVNAKTDRVSLQVGNLQNGIYLLNVSGKDLNETQRFIIQK